MAEGIPVTYRENDWLKHFFRVLGVFALMAGIVLATYVPDGGLAGGILAGAAVGLLAVNEIYFARRKAAQRSVIDTGSGFRWLGGPAEVEVRDSQVVAVRIKHTSKFSAGIPKGVVRRFEVWKAGSDEPMCMLNRIAAGAADPLAALIARVTEDLKQRTAADLAEGAILEGDGWSLAAMQLTVFRGRTVEILPFAEIDKVAVHDGKLCIWRRGRDEPAARISPDSKNASVLSALLGQWIEHQREGSGGQPEATPGAAGMGRLLFERRVNDVFWIGILFAGVGIAVGTGLLFDREAMPVGAVLLVVAAVTLLLAVVFGRFRFRCYELGLTSARGRDQRRLLYDELTEFTYGATRKFHKGMYTGTQFRLLFHAPRAKILYSANVKGMDADLEWLRDHVAGIIAHRMLGKLLAGGSVPWTSDVVFLPQGLQFRRSKLLGLASGPVEVLPYDQLRGVSLNEGLFYIYSTAEAKPVLSKPVNTVNFFPGYAVVLMVQELAASGGLGPPVAAAVAGGE